MRTRLARTALALLGCLSAACSGGVVETWPGTDVVRYRGSTARIDGEPCADGEWHFFFPDGTLHAEGTFEAGALPASEDLSEERTRVPREGRTGRWTFWDQDGRMAAEGRYEEGLRDHLWVCWHETGHHCCTGHFELDVAQGYHATWYPDGSKREERTYVDGRLEGQRTVWDEAGREIWSGAYREGELVSVSFEDLSVPPIHDLTGCADRAELGLPRAPDVAARGR